MRSDCLSDECGCCGRDDCGDCAAGAGSAAAAKEPLCRRAPSLPQLGAEIARCSQQQGAALNATSPGMPIAGHGDRRPPPMAPPPAPSPRGSPPSCGSSTRRSSISGSPCDSMSPAAPSAAPPTRASSDDLRRQRRPDWASTRCGRQPGLLTAGDHDDLLNPMLYARYAVAGGPRPGPAGGPVAERRYPPRRSPIRVQDSGRTAAGRSCRSRSPAPTATA